MLKEKATSSVSSVQSYVTGRHLIVPLSLVTSLFFLWGFSYGLLDVLNKHFQNVLKITKLESTALQIAYFGGGYFCFSPIAGEILKRQGYKITIVLGLILFALGAISFWPAVHFLNPINGRQTFLAFIVCTLIIACGLATLETSANSYVTIIGDPKFASIRLQFCQSWNGVASFIGPLIASRIFFSTHNSTNLNNVQYVYIVVACVAALVAILFVFSKLPEGAIEDSQSFSKTIETSESLWKQYNLIFAFIATFCYVGTQVSNDSFFINYAVENANFTDAKASNLLSYALITFTIGRFVGTLLSHLFHSEFILIIYSIISLILISYVTINQGQIAMIVLMSLYFFESLMFPTIFVMGTTNLGRHARRGAGILIMGISGGAVFPPIQGVIADRYHIRISFLVPMFGLIVVLAYAVFYWTNHGFQTTRLAQSVTDETSIVHSPKSAILNDDTMNIVSDSSSFLPQSTSTSAV